MKLRRRQLFHYIPFIIACFIVLMIVILLATTQNFVAHQNEATIQRETEIIRNYAIQCYASEGSYPPDLNYLEENYGLLLKRDKFSYRYEVFASNIMPDIVVSQKFVVIDDILQDGEQ